MACRIKIKQIITNVVEDKTNSALNKPLSEAQVVANNVNSEFGETVVSFSQEKAGTLNREITVSPELVDVYYDNEVGLERTKVRPPSFDEVERVSNMILNKLVTKTRSFFKKDREKAKEDFLYASVDSVAHDTIKELLEDIIGFNAYRSKFNSPQEQLDNVKKYIMENDFVKQWENILHKVSTSESTNEGELEELHANKRLVVDFANKGFARFDEYSEANQATIKAYFPSLFKENKYKTDKQAMFMAANIAHKKIDREISKEAFRQNFQRLKNEAMIKKYETLINLSKLDEDYRQRIYDRIDNEVNRRLDYVLSERFKDPKIDAVIKYRELYSSSTITTDYYEQERKIKRDGVSKTSEIYFDNLNYEAVKGEVVAESNVVDILKKIIKNRKEYAGLASHLLHYAEKHNVHVNLYNEVRGDASGRYFAKIGHARNEKGEEFSYIKSEEIQIDYTSVNYKADPERLMLHEIIHSLTSIYIASEKYANEQAGKENPITEYLDYIRHYASFEGRDKRSTRFEMEVPYGLTNEAEFITEALTNPAFVEMLKNTPPMNTNRFKNLFEEVIDWIASLFNIAPHSNAYEQMFDVVTGVMEKQSKMELTLEDIIKNAPIDISANQLKAKTTITQDDKSYYRGQYDKPTINANGDLVLSGREDNLYKKAGLKSFGISASEKLSSAIDYGLGQLETRLNIFEDESGYDSMGPAYEEKSLEMHANGYYIIQIPKSITNEIVKEEGEVKIIGDKIIVPKGQYKIEHVTEFPEYFEEEEIATQTRESKQSVANNETINKVKEVMKQMGVSFQALHEYAKGNRDVDTKDVNGLADLTKKVIAVAQGYENVALTEEMVHIATAILEQTDPKMITALISQIHKYKIYDIVFKEYKNRKEYQLANGKPDIRKIKKEAVDKLITEAIIHQSEGSTEFPELLQEVERGVIEGWWEAILKKIRDAFSKSKVDLFEVADVIMKGNFGTVENIKLQGVYLQAASKVGDNPLVDAYYDTVAGYDDRLKLVDETPQKKRHYIFDKIVEVAKSVTEKLGETKTFPDRTELQKKIDDQKKTWGDVGHKFIEKYIKMNLIDQDGFKKKFTSDAVSTKLDLDAQEALMSFCEELINSYPEGTRFLIEKQVINTKEKGFLASTIDFMAIVPIRKENGKDSFVVDILDWKFTDIDKSYEEDVPFYKQDAWRPQMAEYVKMMYEYGLKPGQVRKSRMVPFIMNYVDVVKGDSNSGKRPSSIEIGRLDEAKETKMYLLPVPTYSESTGNPIVDDLLVALRAQWTKLYKMGVEPEQKGPKIAKLNQLSGAIRSLHVKLNFEPMVNVGRTYIETSKNAIKEFKDIDFDKLSKPQIEAKLKELIELRGLSENFILLDEAFISQYGDENLLENDKKTLKELKNIASTAKANRKKILKEQKVYLAYLAQKENIVTEEGAESLFAAEKEIGRFVKSFVEGSRLPAKLINFASNLIMRSKKLADQKFIKHFTEYSKLLMALESSASSKGKKAFQLIGTVDKNGLKLIKKIDSKFWEDLSDAKEKKNKKFILDNIDKDAYMKLANESAAKSIKEYELMQFSTDPKQDRYLRGMRIKNIRKTLDITRSDFTGYDNKTFSYLLSKSLKTENHLSEEYKQMAQDKASLDMWNYFTSLNELAKSLGYIDEQGMAFFPLIEASIIDKFSQTSNFLGETGAFFKDLYSVKSFEKQKYSVKDEETGKTERAIPKYFTTKGSTPVEKLSMDLNKVGALWIKALTDYEAKQNIENTILTMLAVEQSKGSLVTNEKGDIDTEGGHLKVNKKKNENAAVFQDIVDDAFYDLENDLNSFGNIGLRYTANKLGGTEETKESREVNLRKGIDNANTWVRALAVGLKPLIAIANFAGYNFHAIIEGGQMYHWTEFIENGIKVTVGTGLTMEDKALLYQVTLGTENTMEEVRRRLAWNQGLGEYLSTWSFTDTMMLFNSFPERKANLANAKSFNDNAIIVGGKILNARQYLRELDRKSKYKPGVTNAERSRIEGSFEERLKELLNKSTKLTSAVKIVNDSVVIENVSDEEVAKYSLMVSEFARKLNGQMNEKNKAGYRRDAIFSSFMMFKNWIPKLVSSRAGDLKKNLETGDWEYGRTRVMAKVLLNLGENKIQTLTDIISGNEKGLEHLRKMLENKKREHLLNTGEELLITDEEFFDVIRTQINNEFKELGLLFATFALIFAFGFMKPPEDASALEKNRWKWWAKMFNKINEELSFYYLPTSADAITKGSLLPALGILSKATQALNAFYEETKGIVLDDDKIRDAAYPIKYSLNLMPGLAQFMTELLPYIYPELAKELGIRVTEQSRRQ